MQHVVTEVPVLSVLALAAQSSTDKPPSIPANLSAMGIYDSISGCIFDSVSSKKDLKYVN